MPQLLKLIMINDFQRVDIGSAPPPCPGFHGVGIVTQGSSRLIHSSTIYFLNHQKPRMRPMPAVVSGHQALNINAHTTIGVPWLVATIACPSCITKVRCDRQSPLDANPNSTPTLLRPDIVSHIVTKQGRASHV